MNESEREGQQETVIKSHLPNLRLPCLLPEELLSIPFYEAKQLHHAPWVVHDQKLIPMTINKQTNETKRENKDPVNNHYRPNHTLKQTKKVGRGISNSYNVDKRFR